MKSPFGGGEEGGWGEAVRAKSFPEVRMTQEDSQTESGESFLASFDLLEGTSKSTRAKTAETFLELMGARVRNPDTRSAYQVAWRSFLAFCSARQLELESVKPITWERGWISIREAGRRRGSTWRPSGCSSIH
jgi:UPF0288 family protein (methanogenesis marker protein 3)